MDKKKLIFSITAILTLIAVFAGAWFFYQKYQKNLIGAGIPASPETQSKAVILGEDYLKYTHHAIGFSVEYPKELEVLEYLENEDAQTVVFGEKNDSSSDPAEKKTGFQIFISPFDGEGQVITKERILLDIPSLNMEETQEVVLGDGTHALIFWLEDPAIGKTREVWFTDGQNLYEITTYAHLDSWLAKILSTWKF